VIPIGTKIPALLPLDIDINPNSNGLPGIGQLRSIVGASMTVGLILAVACHHVQKAPSGMDMQYTESECKALDGTWVKATGLGDSGTLALQCFWRCCCLWPTWRPAFWPGQDLVSTHSSDAARLPGVKGCFRLSLCGRRRPNSPLLERLRVLPKGEEWTTRLPASGQLEILALCFDGRGNNQLCLLHIRYIEGAAHTHGCLQGSRQVLGAIGHGGGSEEYLL